MKPSLFLLMAVAALVLVGLAFCAIPFLSAGSA
jgi:hypothetical protein